MSKIFQADIDVYTAAKERLREHYAAGDRVIVSISGGKDSTVVMELALEVAREENRLPVEVIMRDEEIMLPGTFEYLERVYQRPDIHFHWVIAGQAIINAYNRYAPYWWVFDPDEQAKWVRQPPPQAQWIDTQVIDGMTSMERFPPAEGKRLIAITGLRANESLMRLTRIAATGGALTKHPTDYGAYTLAPIYDWLDEDVWKILKDKQWDYNQAYNWLYRIGVPKSRLRIAPPSMKQGMATLGAVQKLWPAWFDKVEARLPGMRAAAYYGRRALEPYLQPGQTWQAMMTWIIEDADINAPWLAARARKGVALQLSRHAVHSDSPLPMTAKMGCTQCKPNCPGSWEGLARSLYNGDPWSHYNQKLPPLSPQTFNPAKKAWFEGNKRGKLGW